MAITAILHEELVVVPWPRRIGTTMGKSMPLDCVRLPPPDRPGAYLALVLDAARTTAPTWWSASELELMARFPALELGDAVARLAQRREPMATAEEVQRWSDSAALNHAAQAGWLTVTHATVAGTWFTQAVTGIALSACVQGLIPAALAVATGGERDAWSTLIRTGMGQVAIPGGSPLAALIAHTAFPLSPLPWLTRQELDAWLAASAARDAGPDAVDVPRLMTRLQAAAGGPWRLIGHHLTEIHPWTRLAWQIVRTLPASSHTRRHLLRALRRCPLEPALAAEVWTDVWRIHRLRPLGRRLARHYATWAIWTASERTRWQGRAEARNHAVSAQTWPTRTMAAWLQHDRNGHVLADGVRVEARVLATLHAHGWDGIHAEGWFWAALARQVATDLEAVPVPGGWIAPMQRLAVDTGRWGWLSRRMGAMARLTRRFMNDPTGTIEAAVAEIADVRFATSARAVAAGMDPIVLLALLKRLLCHPEAAAGLPDLLAWKGQQVAMWEVKSPGDQLRDGQRDWLAWGRAHGLQVGVWELVPKVVAQTSFLARPTPVAELPGPSRTARGTSVAVRWRTAPERLSITYGMSVPETNLLWSRSPTYPTGSCTSAGIAMPCGSSRPIVAWEAWRPTALLTERSEGRRVIERRWHLLPAGWWIPLAICEEAHPDGGIRTFATLVMRRAGWWIPARFGQEPVLLSDATDHAAITAEQAASWAVYPTEPPLDVEALVAAMAVAEEFRQQLTCLGSIEHAVALPSPERPVALAVPAEHGVLWVAPAIERGSLDDLLRMPVLRTI